LEIVSLLVLGVFAGVLAGLLGVGGGLIIVPVLVWLFHSHPDIAPVSIMHLALGTSSATIMITAISSIISHHRRGAILWPVALQLSPGIVLGALSGAAVAHLLSSDTLRVVFGIFVLLIAIQMGFGAQPAPHRQLPRWEGMSLVGVIIGLISALVGIGGGSLTVPFLAWCNVAMRNAVATSAACGFPIAVSSTVGFIIMGWQVDGLPAGSTGYVYWPAFIAIVPMTLLFAPLGAKLAHSIPVNTLKRFFALFLAAVAIKMLLS
jgi:uncharacterized membrane protein YfcA